MIVSFSKDKQHVTPVLHDLHWLLIGLRVHFKIIHYTYKKLNEHAPPYICDMMETYNKPPKSLRSGSQCMLVFPKIRTKGYGGQINSYAAATLWNDLNGTDLKKGETVSAF